MLETGFHLGSRWQKFFVRVGMDWVQSDYFPLSGNFELNALQPTYERVNSDQRDIRYNGRFGYTPNDQDQYVFTYNKQKSDYGVPPYAGNDTKNNKVKVLGLGHAGTGTAITSIPIHTWENPVPLSSGHFGIFTPTAWICITTARIPLSWGQGSSEYETIPKGFPPNCRAGCFRAMPWASQVPSKAMSIRNDPSAIDSKGKVTVEPWRRDRDELVSVGVQDAITLASKLHAILGFSADHINATHANDINKTTNTIVPFNCGSPTSRETCPLLSEWSYNPLASISYSVAKTGTAVFLIRHEESFPHAEGSVFL